MNLGNLIENAIKQIEIDKEKEAERSAEAADDDEALENELFSNIDNPDYLKDKDFEEFSELNDDLKKQDDNTIKKLLDGEL